MSKIIKVSTDLEVTVHDFPQGTIREQNKKLYDLIGNGCEMIEQVMQKGDKELERPAAYNCHGHVERNYIEEILKGIAKAAGVAEGNPHKYRRTCATMALRRGMPVEQVSKMLGHEQLTTTQIYLDIDEENMKAAHRKYVV